MRIFLSVLLVLTAASSFAQSAYDSPLVSIPRAQPKEEAPAAPKPMPAPAAPAPVAAPATQFSVASRLWPSDTIPIFVTRCSKLRAALIEPCNCIITNVMNKIPHDEFLAIDAAGALETDQRLIDIRQQCVSIELLNRKRNANPGRE